ncbi:DUF1624 domain-containing protein [Rhizobium sp. CG5]|uniref:heparan-alpha-glucosaminide N-acetyltransferase n=1 Tax=Rhizobium sp. CG5 TaxID=2726076 RepID=UPI0020347DBD
MSSPSLLPTTATPTPRIGLLDAARGLALIAMASYHFTWDLEFFGYIEPGTATHGWWKIYARLIAGTFLFLAGASLALAHEPAIRWRSFGKRFAVVAGAAAAITVATAIAMPQGMIFFGILHCIALTSLLALPFLRLPIVFAVLAAVVSIVVPIYLHSPIFDAPWFWWLGLSENLPRSNDYVPLLPWFAPVLLGLAAMRIARRFGWLDALAALPKGPGLLRLAGRHSLLVYLLHQPVLIALVYLASLLAPPPPPDPLAGYMRSCEASCAAQGSEAAVCTRFCGCTLTSLQQAQLFEPLQSGAIQAEHDERILKIARECTAASQ